MCWETRYIPELIKAKEDIPIFKVLTPYYASYYAGFMYSLNTIYATTLEDPVRKHFIYEINFGFHSYDRNIVQVDGYEVFCTLYSKRLDAYGDSFIIVDGVIPRGSMFYVNEYGEYVSDHIKLTNRRTLCVGQHGIIQN